ncbi:gamma-glutamylcyclotransferase family protein [Hydrogenobacter thermophilus]|uniref:gamma-glutamylcyclotransferase family protein n=1 Tax=Hydrogenobacter thermophilus TaxID=940 RepID=UPI0030FB6DB3
MPYYFAHGSNMSQRQMKERCKEGKFKTLGRAFLRGYRLVFDGYSISWDGSVANLVPLEGGIVWGVLYEVSEECIKKLDECEGVSSGYYKRVKVEVHSEDGKSFMAYTYLREPLEEGKPSREYIETLLEGAEAVGLPEEYVNKYIRVYLEG